MADYQLLGDGFGYNIAYEETGNVSSNSAQSSIGSGNQLTGPSNISLMNPLMSSSLNTRPGGQSYHQPGSTLIGGPTRGLGYSATGQSPVPNSPIDTSKLHNLYAPGCGNLGSLGAPFAQSAQYPSQDGRYQQQLGDYSPSAFSEHLNRLPQHSANIVPQSSISPMSMGPSGYHSRGIMGHYSDPRMPSNLGPPQQTSPSHGLGTSYPASSYSYGHGDHLSSGSGLWQNQGVSHSQERSSYGYQTGLHSSGPSVSVSNLPMSDPRSGQSFGPSSSEFSSLHQQPSTQQRSFYSSNQNPESSSLSSHIPSDCSSISSYSTHQGPYSASHGAESSVNLNQNRGSSRLSHNDALRQTQFSVSYSGPNVNLQSSHPPPSTPPHHLSSSGSSIPPSNSGSNVRYPHQQYSTHSSGQIYGDTSSSASRLSPYGLPNSGPQAGSNSPNFRPNQLTAASPMSTSRTPERMSNSGLSLQQGYSSPGASQIKNSSSNILSPNSSNSALSHISSSQLASSSNSLHQLEQMAIAHLSPTLGSNKMTPVSSVASSSAPNSFYSPSVSSDSIQSSSQAAFQQSSYSQYSSPSSASSGLSQQSPNYYQQQQQRQQLQQYQSSTSNMWQAQSNPSTPSTSSHLNTHSSMTSAAYSAQQLPSTQKQPSSSSSVNSSAAAVADSQYSLFENESEHAKSIISSDNSEASILSPCQSNISQIQSQQESLSPFGIRGSVNKSGVPFGSPQSSQEEELKQSKSQSDSKDSKLENEFGLKQSQSHEQSSNLFNVLASPESNRFSNEQDRTVSDSQSRSVQQSSATTADQNFLSDQASSYITGNEANFMSSPTSQQGMYQQTYSHQTSSATSGSGSGQAMNQGYVNNYSASYDMCMNQDQMNTLNTYNQADSLQYDQNYNQNSAMNSMMSGQMSNYGNTSMGDMSSMPAYDPYDDTFGSEPPVGGGKRKGKGRPKKGSLEPRKEKKPRQPRLPKSARGVTGRGRGGRNSTESRISLSSPLQSQSSLPPSSLDQSHEFGNNENEPSQIYPSIINQSYQSSAGSMEPMTMSSPPLQTASTLQSPTTQQPASSVEYSMSMPQKMYPQSQSVDLVSMESQDSRQLAPMTMSFGPQDSSSFSKQNEIEKEQVEKTNDTKQDTLVKPQVTSDQVSSNLNLESSVSDEAYNIKTDINESTNSNYLSDSSLFEVSNQENSSSLQLSSSTQEFSNQDSSMAIESESKSQKHVPAPILAPENDKEKSEKVNEESKVTSTKRKGKKRKPKELPEVQNENAILDEVSPPKVKKKKKGKKKLKVNDEDDDEDANDDDNDDDVEQQQVEQKAKDENDDFSTSTTQPTGEQSINNELDETIVDDMNYFNQEEDISLTKLKKVKNKTAKSKKPKLKELSSKSKSKLPKLALKLGKKKKRKRLGSSDNSDIDKTPVPSPEAMESGVLKRRSARNTKRQKYTDDIDLELSEGESTLDDKKSDEKMDEGQVQISSITEDKILVEKIMSSRMAEREIELEEEKEDGKPEMAEVEEFYVKYKNLSYLHCEWKTEEELEKGDKRINQKVKRFKQKKDGNLFDFLDEEPFNPDYTEVDRILDIKEVEVDFVEESSETTQENDKGKNEDELINQKLESKENEMNQIEVSEKVQKDDKSDKKIEKDVLNQNLSEPIEDNIEIKPNDKKPSKFTNDDNDDKGYVDDAKDDESKALVGDDNSKKPKKIIRHFLVKWRALPYEESTWEIEDDIDPLKIQHFLRYKNPPPKDKWKPKKRPKASEWKKLATSPVYKSGNTLREYQLEGVNWLMFCWHNTRNCILADEMGLGKTIQSIAFTQEMVNYGVNGPFLIIAPLSTIGNWQREFETWTDLNVVVYHGSSASRNIFQEYEMHYKKENGEIIENVYKFQIMITTFEIVLTDCLELKKINWRACIIDEAHRLKNRNCKLLEGLRLLDVEHRVLLTGTPLQNNVEELFSLLNFLEPGKFASSDLFLQEFGDLKTEDQVDKLKSILKPMMLRRLKEDVEKTLAPKEETIIEVELTNAQKKYYRAILERNFQFLTKGNTSSNVPNLMNTMMELRKCCIHPYLINGAEDQILYEYKASKGDGPTLHLDAMIQASGKLVLIDKLLPRLRSDGHRVLIFSQMVRCLDILEDYLIQKRYPFERIDGRVRGNLRQAAIDRFCKPDSDRFVFLLCTRAGGLGINLTAADTVIIFDSDWNPQNDLQAQARCHRIGQSKMVKVYRLICRNTYEREMFDKASLKLGLDRAVLQSMNTQKSQGIIDTGLSKKEVEDLLRKGAYGAIMDDDNAGDKFCEEDIEQILQRRTHVITIENEQKGSTFSKASFASSDNRTDIEIDDPNFWEKWAKKAQIDVNELKDKNELIVQEPRKRTQTKRFGQDDALLEMSDVNSSDDDDDSLSTRTRGSKSRIKGKKNKKGRLFGRDDILEEFGPGNWTKAECFEIEKGLLCFGWGRWNEILSICNFRRNLIAQDVEDVSRAIITFCLQNCRGDDKKREVAFLWEVIAPSENELKALAKNDLSDPQYKKSKIKKAKKEENNSLHWTQEDIYNPNLLFTDEQYRKQLFRSANKILSRIKMLFYLKHEIIGNLAGQIILGLSHREAQFLPQVNDGFHGLPTWWDEEADKSLIMGIFKHGYDRYSLMRLDPSLCFLSRCGPPDNASLLADSQKIEEDLNKGLDEDEALLTSVSTNLDSKNETETKVESDTNGQILPFPSSPDLNKRFRTLLALHQKNVKRQAKLALQVRNLDKFARFESVLREGELFKPKPTPLRKWSRRDESDFYRIISSFGVEYNKNEDGYDWNKFRTLSKLDKKSDFSLTEYFKAFYAMCKRATGRKTTKEEENLPILVDPISEERANRILARIDLLSKIRVKILKHPELDARLKLCQSSSELPEWWEPGKHDKDLLKGTAKYGLNRLDFYLMHDGELSFRNVLRGDKLTKKLQETKPKTEIKVTIDMKSFEKQFEQNLLEEMIKEQTEKEAKLEKEQNEVKNEKNEILEGDNLSKIKKEDETEKEEPIIEQMKAESDNLKVESNIENNQKEIDEKSVIKSEQSKVDDKLVEKPEKEDKMGNETIDKSEDKIDKKIDEQVVDKIEERIENMEEKVDEKLNEKLEEKVEKKIGEKITDVDESMEEKAEKSNQSEGSSVDLKSQIEKKIKESSEEVEMVEDLRLENKKPDLNQNEIKIKCEESEKEEDLSLKSSENENTSKEQIKSEIGNESIKADTELIEIKQEAVENNTGLAKNEAKNLSNSTFQMLAKVTVRWPKDKVLHLRLEQICYCVEKNEWPSERQTLGIAAAIEATHQDGPDSPPRSVSPGRDSSRLLGVDNSSCRDTLSPLSDYLYAVDNSPLLNDPSQKRKRRRLREGEVDSERAKLRDLLSQQMDPSVANKSLQASLANSSLINPSFLPPLFSMTFGNLRSGLRKDLPTDDKTTASLLISNALASKHSLHRSHIKSSSSSSCFTNSSEGPPPAHQNSSSKRTSSIDAFNLRYKAGNSLLSSSPVTTAPTLSSSATPSSKLNLAHKPITTSTVDKTASPSSPTSVLDLSSGPSTRKSSTSSLSQSTGNSPQLNLSLNRKVVKKSKSKIDDLAFTLRQKKMMEEKQAQPQQDVNIRDSKNRSEFEKSKQEQKFLAPPAAHSSSSSSSFTKMLDTSIISKLQPSASGSPSAVANQALSAKLAKSTFLEQASALKKWLEENPKMLAENPTLVAAVAAANAIGIGASSSIPANTELLELPDNKRKVRRVSKPESNLNSSLFNLAHLTGEENVPVINRITGKKIIGPKAPPLKHLHDWLAKNPMFDVDPKWQTMFLEKSTTPKTATATSSSGSGSSGSIRTRTSDRKLGDNSSRRSASTTLLSNSSSGSNLSNSSGTSSNQTLRSNSSTNPLGLSSSALSSLGFNPNFIPNLSSMKMFMDASNFSLNSRNTNKGSSSTSTTNASSLSSSAATNAVQSMLFPFGGLAAGIGLNNPFFGFNIPGLTSGSNPLSLSSDNKKSDKDFSSSSSSSSSSQDKTKGSEKSNTNSKSSKSGNNNSNNVTNSTSSSNSAAANTNLYTTSGLNPSALPFLYPNPNLLYNSFGLGNFPLSSPFASLAAQSGLMNGLGNLNVLSNLSSKSSSSSSTSSANTTNPSSTLSSSASKSKASSSSSSKLTAASKNQLGINSASLLSNLSQSSLQELTSSGLLTSSTAAAADSDDESLKSLMGHNDDDDDLNGDLDDNELNEKDDSDHEATPSKKSRLKKSQKFKGHKSK